MQALQSASAIQLSLDGLGGSLANLGSAVTSLQAQQAQMSKAGRETLDRAASIQGTVAGIDGSLRAVQAAGVRALEGRKGSLMLDNQASDVKLARPHQGLYVCACLAG